MLNDYLINGESLFHIEKYLDSLTDLWSGEKIAEIRKELNQLLQSSGQHDTHRLSYEQWWGLLDAISMATGNDHVGIDIGAGIKTSDCGLIGYLFRTSPNIYAAFQAYQRYERLLYSGSRVSALESEGVLWLSWDPENGLSSQQSDSLLMAALIGILREISDNKTVNPVAIKFTQSLPSNASHYYEKHFRCPILSQQPRLEIGFDLIHLKAPLASADSALNKLLQQQAEQAMEHVPDEQKLIVVIKKHLTRMLQEGQSSAKQLATRMHISERSLHRKLNANQLLYREVLKSLRLQLAKEYLADERLSLSEVALLLGYSEQSALCRACKAWTNQTPQSLRQSLQRLSGVNLPANEE